MIEQDTKVFRDNVHGYIKIPLDYVEQFIDTEMFQRLRQIEQTGMRTLYPSARHDRFIHSLGTYFLGHKAFVCFRENVKKRFNDVTDFSSNYYSVFSDRDQNELFWDKCGVLFEIACLLHDCGHAPFSHTLEFHYDKEAIREPIATLKDKLKVYNGSQEFAKDFKGQGSPHERMSALIVCTEYKKAIESLSSKYGFKQINDVSDIEFISRMIIGCKYQKETKANQIRNCFIELLNSKSIDVDSLDYIIRDSKLSGVDNMNIDVDRLLGALTLVEETEFLDVPFYGVELTTNVKQGLLSKMDGQQAEVNGKFRGSLELKENISGRIGGLLDVSGSFKTLDEVIMKDSSEGRNIITVNGVAYTSKLEKLDHSATIRLHGSLSNDISVKGDEINFGEDTNADVSLSSDRITLSSMYVNAKLSGIFSGEVLGNYSHIFGGKLKCRLGFHKSSLSVIQNVIIARNYEYQWIYSHHKVVYSSNYLIIDLLRNCIEYLLKKEHQVKLNNGENTPEGAADDVLAKMISWDTMICHSSSNLKYHFYRILDNSFFRLCDAEIISIFKQCYINCINEGKTNTRLYALLQEYYTRKFKHSLWKSFAEYNLFFCDFTVDERKSIFKLMIKNSSYHLFDQYGYFNEEWENAFHTFGMHDVVWVNGDSKLKALNPDDTFILFKNEALTYRTVSASSDIKPVTKLDLFYIYFKGNSQGNVDKDGFREFIKNKIALSK